MRPSEEFQLYLTIIKLVVGIRSKGAINYLFCGKGCLEEITFYQLVFYTFEV